MHVAAHVLISAFAGSESNPQKVEIAAMKNKPNDFPALMAATQLGSLISTVLLSSHAELHAASAQLILLTGLREKF